MLRRCPGRCQHSHASNTAAPTTMYCPHAISKDESRTATCQSHNPGGTPQLISAALSMNKRNTRATIASRSSIPTARNSLRQALILIKCYHIDPQPAVFVQNYQSRPGCVSDLLGYLQNYACICTRCPGERSERNWTPTEWVLRCQAGGSNRVPGGRKPTSDCAPPAN